MSKILLVVVLFLLIFGLILWYFIRLFIRKGIPIKTTYDCDEYGTCIEKKGGKYTTNDCDSECVVPISTNCGEGGIDCSDTPNTICYTKSNGPASLGAMTVTSPDDLCVPCTDQRVHYK